MSLKGRAVAVSIAVVSSAALLGTGAAQADDGPLAGERHTVYYSVSFDNPGEWGDPEPYGRVYLKSTNGGEVGLWAQERKGGDTPSVSRYPSSGQASTNFFFDATTVNQVCAYVDEWDSGNGDDKLANDCVTFEGANKDYKITGDDGHVLVSVGNIT